MVNITKFVKCRKTGFWYDPEYEFKKVFESLEILGILKRLSNK